tara:strand:- start:66 stop:227 length:162 start_codon:yes stop_codon:yes gene_type:complete
MRKQDTSIPITAGLKTILIKELLCVSGFVLELFIKIVVTKVKNRKARMHVGTI